MRAWWRLVSVIALAIVIVAAPTADLVCFGFHDHLADSDHRDGQSGTLGGLHHSSHHCDLGMNPGHVVPLFVFITPSPAAEDGPSAVARAVVARPLAPFTPPRA